MKQTSIILLIPLIGIFEVLLTWEQIYLLRNFVYLEMIVLCFCGVVGLRRDLWLLLCVFYSWIAISDQIFYFSQAQAYLEAALFFVLVYWVNIRPLWIPSDPPSNTLQFAFYRGNKTPFISKVGQLFGLPVGGVAVIINDDALRPVGLRGVLELRQRSQLKMWIKLDTKIRVSNDIKKEFNNLIGKQTGKAGCLRALRPILSKTPLSGSIHPSGLLSEILDSRLY